MKVLYFTDLHGNYSKCEHSFELISKHKPDIVINGGDLLSIDGEPFKEQPKFLEWFKKMLTTRCQAIPYLFIFGNDDLKAHSRLFAKLEDSKLLVNLSGSKAGIHGYEFIGYSYIPNNSYMLKDWRKLDDNKSYDPYQAVDPMISSQNGYETIANLKEFLLSRGTIKQDLEELPSPDNYSKTVYVIHAPPAGLNLDIPSDGKPAGSRSIYEFIKKKQPLLSLHGHIHESPALTNKYYEKIEKTICIQPGQDKFISFNLEDIENSLEVLS